jgi:hypothetical protein
MLASGEKKNGGVGASQANSLLQKLVSDQKKEVKEILKDKKKYKKYIETVEQVTSNRFDEFSAKEVLVNAMSDGVIDGEEARQLKDIKKNLEAQRWNNKDDVITNTFKYLKSWFSDNNPDDEDLAEAFRKMTREGIGSGDPKAFADEIIENEKVKLNPEYAHYQIGQMLALPTGNYKVVGFHPDGMPDMELIGQ